MTSSSTTTIGLAFMWGLISAMSLTAGAMVAIVKLPSHKTRAAMMAFGAGALLFALSVELFGNTLFEHELAAHLDGEHEGYNYDLMESVLVMVASALLGGLSFFTMDQFLNNRGAFLRSPSALLTRRGKGWVNRLRGLLQKRALDAFQHEEKLFAAASPKLLADLILPFVQRRVVASGDVILDSQGSDTPLYIVLSGTVSLHFEPGEEEEEKEGWMAEARAAPQAPLLVKRDGLFGELALLAGRPVRAKAVAGGGDGGSGGGGGGGRRGEVVCSPKKEMVSLLKIDRQHINALLEASAEAAIELNRARQACAFLLGGCGGGSGPPPPMAPPHPSPPPPLPSAAATGVGGDREDAELGMLQRGRYLANLPISMCSMMALIALGVIETYVAGDVIYNEVDTYSPFYLIVEGAVNISNLDEGEELDEVTSPFVEAEAIMPLLTDKSADETKETGKNVGLLDSGNLDQSMPVLAGHLAGPGSLLCTQALTPGVNREIAMAMTSPTVVIYLSRPRRERLAACHPDLGAAFRAAAADPTGAAARRPPPAPADREPGPRLEDVIALEDMGSEKAETVFSEALRKRISAVALARKHTAAEAELESILAAAVPSGPPHPTQRDTARSLQLADLEAHQHQEDLEAISDMDVIEMGASEEKDQRNTALVIWLGICIDAVPESMVIGFLVAEESLSPVLVLVVGVFLSNFPEAMSSSAMMLSAGLRPLTILLMWSATALCTAVGAAVGAAIVPAAYVEEGGDGAGGFELFVQGMEGLAAGAMLAMIAQTMLPHAFHEAGAATGLTCLAGFLSALLVRLVPI